MTLQNRVTPNGDIISTAARGSLMGNRGQLHDDGQRIVRKTGRKPWVICLLSFKERRRNLMSPNQYTELFFLDEATALAAGHRPCNECQRERAQAFKNAWTTGNPEKLPLGRRLALSDIDDVLHGERINRAGDKLTYQTDWSTLPDGVMVMLQEDSYNKGNHMTQYWLVKGSRILHWTPEGYADSCPRPTSGKASVLTPKSVVKAIAAGYAPSMHQSAQ